MSAKRIIVGIYCGLAAGAVFGVMMGVMGMLPTVGHMVGSPTVLAGFLVHLVISAMVGAGFGLIFGRPAFTAPRGLAFGLIYGLFWWLLGPLTLMPLLMGMGLGSSWNMTSVTMMIPNLIGHVVYGLILGGGFGWIQKRQADFEAASSCSCCCTISRVDHAQESA